jgi:hypothetical protein
MELVIENHILCGLGPLRNMISLVGQVVVLMGGNGFELGPILKVIGCSHHGFTMRVHLFLSLFTKCQIAILIMIITCSCLSHLRKWLK